MPAIALYAWPVVTLLLYAKLGPARGLIWSVMLGYLLLPQMFDIDLPGLPPLNKMSVVPLSVLAATFIFDRRKPGQPRPVVDKDPLFQTLLWIMIGFLILSPLGTVLSNGRPLVYGERVINGLGTADIRSMYIETIFLTIPFFLAIRMLNDPKAHGDLLRALVYGGAAYSLLVLVELRLSPQFHTWVYGYFPHGWGQHLRGGFYRPVVFLEHGLSLGFFLFTLALASFALARRATATQRTMFLLAGFYFLALLAVSSNTGALILAILFVPLLFFTTRRMQMRVVVLIAVLFMIYPAMRQTGIVPVDDLVATVNEKINAERSGSLAVRIENEELLLEHSAAKPVFGWGGWGRWRVFDERGRDIIIADGLWIITLSERGWAGYIGLFGLMILPLFLLARARRRRDVPPTTVCMAVITAGNLIYILPNSTLSPIAFLMMGAMAGFVRNQQPEGDGPVTETPDPGTSRRQAPNGRQGGPVYTRFANAPPQRQTVSAAASEPAPTPSKRSAYRYGRQQQPQGARSPSVRGSR